MVNYSNNLQNNSPTKNSYLKDQTIKNQQSENELFYHHSSNSCWHNIPFSFSAFCSIISLVMLVKAIAINGYIVDHSLWDGYGHHYDKNPVVSLNTIEITFLIISLCFQISIWLLLILKSKFYEKPISTYCLWLSLCSGNLNKKVR
ncbi:unnamed protein product [Cunninghamella echinulata]